MSNIESRDIRIRENVIGTPVDVVDWNGVLSKVFDWARRRDSKFVCLCNVHNLVVARQDGAHARALASADIAAADGAPVAWALRRAGHDDQTRISGPDLMWRCCEIAAREGTPMFLYGSTESILSRLAHRLRRTWPDIRIVGEIAPPFRPLSDEEDLKMVELINSSGAGIVWVGLGCPKQEAWMARHRDQIKAVMIGVGAAFDFHAGAIKRAPLWMQRHGLEWLHRLCQDPRRLARRYLTSNTHFILAMLSNRPSRLDRLAARRGG